MNNLCGSGNLPQTELFYFINLKIFFLGIMYDRLGWVTEWEHTIFAVNVFCAFIKSYANLGMDLVS